MLEKKQNKVENVSKNPIRIFLAISICIVAILSLPVASHAKFFQTFGTRNGGASLSNGDEHLLAKFDRVILNRFVYDDIGDNTWNALKNINPNTQIYLYQLGRETDNDDDENSIVFLNNVGRWNISRGHSMGNLNNDNSNLLSFGF